LELIVDNINLIVIHCSDSPHGRDDGAKEIHRWHIQRGFDGIGYHYVINEYGDVENGRPEYWQGAHVSGYNENSLGICLLGKSFFSDDQMLALRRLIAELKRRHKDAEVVGHRDLDDEKTCPNFNVRKWCRQQGL
jgi:N-acetylmuramoyl-L-alanine amidase